MEIMPVGNQMTLSSCSLSATSRLFSSSVFREMAEKGRSALFARLIKKTPLIENLDAIDRVGDAFDAALNILRRGNQRDEYVYKAALTRNILLGKHSLRTASMLREFRVGKCKADLAILNGTATVYEIKSERDSLSRLETQIAAYMQVFAKVFVIAGENHIDAVLDRTPQEIGVMCLSKRHNISTLRDATDCPERVSPLMILGSVRADEAKLILQRLGVEVPQVPNTLLRAELRLAFEKLEPALAHRAMVDVLKRTRDLLPLEELLQNLPSSLQAAVCSVPLKRRDHERLVRTVNTPILEALSWA
ncbi:sce7726 family protein [Sphingomonas sp. HITSZ_GF]|uniref:sce7726 family protein n=1 Tax=Sphingomonas sp. HITSZ_GF TaxID=3037247 RepID=UPI00240DC6D4|nr:sce7726 family protein [Sphingomonas sp. HITSZ_GF]MDG2532210.1 sce7726 family protein [Sphingomonas sp. HITSZ_GF]